MFSFPLQISKYGDAHYAVTLEAVWLLVGWQIRGRLHFDIYNVFLPQFSVGCSPYGWLRRPPWGPDTAGPISQAVISRPPSKSWKLTNPPSHNSPLPLICTTSMYSTHIFSKSIISPFWPDHSWVILVNMVISVILGHEKTKIQNIIDLGKIDVFSVKTIIHNNNKKMGHLIWPLGV